jgi:hypothetical protein
VRSSGCISLFSSRLRIAEPFGGYVSRAHESLFLLAALWAPGFVYADTCTGEILTRIGDPSSQRRIQSRRPLQSLLTR